MICLHGLGSNKTSFFETVSTLTPDHTVHAIDLPGFGSSSKPARGAYDAPYFARAVLGYMDAMAIERAHLVGNSMGGRVAIELGAHRARPGRDAQPAGAGAGLPAPARAGPAGEAAPPRAGGDPASAEGTRRSASGSGACSRDRSGSTPPRPTSPRTSSCRTYRSRSARIAFFAAARNIYLDAPHGEDGLWTRLAGLRAARAVHLGRPTTASSRPPSPGTSRDALPDARQVVLDRVRPRSPGRAARARQRADPRTRRSARRSAAPHSEPGSSRSPRRRPARRGAHGARRECERVGSPTDG